MYKTVTVNDIRKRGANVLVQDSPSYLIVNSKIASVLVPPDYFEMLEEALEDLQDIKAAEAALIDGEFEDFDDVVKEIQKDSKKKNGKL